MLLIIIQNERKWRNNGWLGYENAMFVWLVLPTIPLFSKMFLKTIGWYIEL